MKLAAIIALALLTAEAQAHKRFLVHLHWIAPTTVDEADITGWRIECGGVPGVYDKSFEMPADAAESKARDICGRETWWTTARILWESGKKYCRVYTIVGDKVGPPSSEVYFRVKQYKRVPDTPVVCPE